MIASLCSATSSGVAASFAPASASGFSDQAWATFAELGLMAIALPEADGGFGGGAIDLMAPMMACGAGNTGAKQVVKYQADYIFYKAM